jgi:hypothetical protein
MRRLAVLLVAAALAIVLPVAAMVPAALADQGELPIMADDGTVIANHRLAPGLEAQIEKMPGVIVAANPHGKVTLAEFYDLNCLYCRKAAADIAELVRSNPDLRLVLVPFPVLGIASIQGARVEIAVARLLSADKFYAYHHALYAGRGMIDGSRAVSATRWPSRRRPVSSSRASPSSVIRARARSRRSSSRCKVAARSSAAAPRTSGADLTFAIHTPRISKANVKSDH